MYDLGVGQELKEGVLVEEHLTSREEQEQQRAHVSAPGAVAGHLRQSQQEGKLPEERLHCERRVWKLRVSDSSTHTY